MAGCKTKKYADGGMVRGGPGQSMMAPRISRMPPPDQSMPGPRISRMPPPGMQNTGRLRVAGPPPNAPPMASAPAAAMGTRTPGAPAPVRAFKKGGFVSKVKPSGGRGTKSCKIC